MYAALASDAIIIRFHYARNRVETFVERLKGLLASSVLQNDVPATTEGRLRRKETIETILLQRKTDLKFASSVPQLGIGAWAIGMSMIVACLMVGHWLPLPRPESGTVLTTPHDTQSNAEKSRADQERFTALHFLYADCPCSRRVLRHVLNRSPIAGINERIVLIKSDGQSHHHDIKRTDYTIETVFADQLKKTYGVESAPLLLVVDSHGTIVYSGGYSARKQGLDIQDERLIRESIAGTPIVELPVYGCAVSKSLKSIVDPLGIK